MNIVGKVISGQVTGDTAKQSSERFGKIMPDRESISIKRTDTVSKSKQLEAAVPPSRIASLSRGESVGMVADDPDCRIDLKIFHCRIKNKSDQLKIEEFSYREIPSIRILDDQAIQDSYMQIKLDVQLIIEREMEDLRALKKTIAKT